MKYEREPQPEVWWKKRTCPVHGLVKSDYGVACTYCTASECALWRETAQDHQGNKCGICTL